MNKVTTLYIGIGLTIYLAFSGCSSEKVSRAPADEPSNPVLTSLGPVDSHVSDTEHDNYLIFKINCPSGMRATQWQAQYDSQKIFHGLYQEWIAQSGDNESEADFTKRVTDDLEGGALGGLLGPNLFTPIVSCTGDLVEIRAFMRTRFVSTGIEAALLRTWERLPNNTDVSLALYSEHTRITYSCVAC